MDQIVTTWNEWLSRARLKRVAAAALSVSAAVLAARDALALDDPEIPSRPAATAFSRAYERLKTDVSFLAADAQDGRAPGTKGIETAATYISEVFRKAGLKTAPGANGYFQPFAISGSPVLGLGPELAVRGPNGAELKGKPQTDFNPLAIGTGAKLSGVPIVFAGYGITANDEALKLDYDDYAGIDVHGKAVLILRREPQQGNDTSRFDGTRMTRYATFQHKATNAFQHGAVAVLIANDKAGLGGEPDRLLPFNAAGFEVYSDLPVVMLTREFADRLMSASGEPTLAEIEDQIDGDLKPRSRELKGWQLDEKVSIERHGIDTKNVIGVIEGAGPHADETVVIGGHYDHLGHGGFTSGSLAALSSDIHNGADDNASGTAMVLELARRLGARPDPPPRRIVFIAFSGEERGLLGSAYYVAHPLFPLSSTVMMINCDMVGRLNAKNELTMIGTGTSPGIDGLVDVLGKSAGLSIKKVAGMTDGFGGSDHQSFYAKNIPVLFAFTGIHADYHRPSDDTERINFAGMERIADYLEVITLDIVRRPERTTYLKVNDGSRAPRTASASGRPVPSLGVMPDYSNEAKEGMAISDVRADGPAAKGGLKGGDVIIKLGDRTIKTIYDYMASLEKYKPGDQVEVVVRRGGKEVKLPVTLGTRARE